MKKFNFFLLAAFLAALISCAHSCGQDDPELDETLRQLKPHACLTDRRFPNLPTEEDINRLEAALLNPGYKLPSSLKKYHLMVGNLIFSGVDFPTVHNIEDSGKYRSNLLGFIRDGWNERGIPYNTEETWIPFGNEGGDYVCMNLYTGSVCYFCGIVKLKKSKEEYPTLSEWLRKEFLSE